MSISCWTFFNRAALPACALLLRPVSEELLAVQEAVLHGAREQEADHGSANAS